MEKYLIKKAYEFYPKYIYGFDSSYINTVEISNMKEYFEKSINKEYKIWKNIIAQNQNKYSILDKTSFTLNQPSLVLQIIISKNKTNSIVLNCYYSLLIPFYYYIKTIYDENKMKIFEEINGKIDDENILFEIEDIGKRLNKNLFPKEYLFNTIPKISFEAIEDGKFNMMNAFFNYTNTFI